MEKAIRPPSPLSYLHHSSAHTNTSSHVISPNVGGSTLEIELDKKVDSTITEIEAVQPLYKLNNDNKHENLKVRDSKRIKSLLATRRLAGISMEEDTTAPLAVKGSGGRQGSNGLFKYQRKERPTAGRSLQPLITPGDNLAPDILKEVRAGWAIYSGSLSSDLGQHWLKVILDNSKVIDQGMLPPLNLERAKATREMFKVVGISMEERIARLAAEIEASFIITGRGKSKWIRVGPTEGTRMVLDVRKSTLKIWTRQSARTQTQLRKSPRFLTERTLSRLWTWQ